MNAIAPVRDLVCLCGGRDLALQFDYREPPQGEVRFGFSAGTYRRQVLRCTRCGHYLSAHGMDMRDLYHSSYVDSTYGADGIQRAFERIVALDPARSDNVGRVNRVVAFAESFFGAGTSDRSDFSILDVGSGLCVFLHRIRQQTRWRCTALDPDPRAVEHARNTVGVTGICGDFMTATDIGTHDIITFNKVLEHVRDPVAMFARAARHLKSGAIAYLELPDGEAAAAEGPGREEFFIDHHHVFSPQSLRVLAAKAGFEVIDLERLREASSKFTLRAFLRPVTMQRMP